MPLPSNTGSVGQSYSQQMDNSNFERRGLQRAHSAVDFNSLTQPSAQERASMLRRVKSTSDLREPPKATNLKRSFVFAIAGFCMGALSGVGIGMLFWNGLQDRFNKDGVGVDVDGTADLNGNVDAGGDIQVDGTADLGDFEGGIGGFTIDLGDWVDGGADVGFDGSFAGDGLSIDGADIGIGVDGDAAVDIGGAAPVKVIVSAAMVFGIVVGAFTWLIERQLSAAADRKQMMAKQNDMHQHMVMQQQQILEQQAEINQKLAETQRIERVRA